MVGKEGLCWGIVREVLGYGYFEEFCLGVPESDFNLVFSVGCSG